MQPKNLLNENCLLFLPKIERLSVIGSDWWFITTIKQTILLGGTRETHKQKSNSKWRKKNIKFYSLDISGEARFYDFSRAFQRIFKKIFFPSRTRFWVGRNLYWTNSTTYAPRPLKFLCTRWINDKCSLGRRRNAGEGQKKKGDEREKEEKKWKEAQKENNPQEKRALPYDDDDSLFLGAIKKYKRGRER